MKKRIFLAFFILGTISLSAQTSQKGFDLTQLPSQQNEALEFYNKSQLEKIPISVGEARFLKDSLFREGELRTHKGLFTTQLSYRFDQIERTIEVKLEDGKRMYLDAKDVVYCKLFFEDHTAVFMPIILPKDKELTLAQVVYRTPTLQLYRDIRKTVTRKVQFRTTDFVDEVKNDYHYYFRKNSKASLVEVEINAKSFIKVLPDKQNRITYLFKGKKKESLTMSKLVYIMGELDKSNKPDG